MGDSFSRLAAGGFAAGNSSERVFAATDARTAMAAGIDDIRAACRARGVVLDELEVALAGENADISGNASARPPGGISGGRLNRMA